MADLERPHQGIGDRLMELDPGRARRAAARSISKQYTPPLSRGVEEHQVMRHAIAVSGLLAVFAGTGKGQELFSRTDYSLGATQPIQVVAADVDGDGFQDLLVVGATATGTGEVHVLINSGNGKFTEKAVFTTTLSAYAAAVADFDLDGDPDLAVGAGYMYNGVEIFENRAGTYVSVNTLPAPNGDISGIVARDLDGDANPDLTVVESGDVLGCLGMLVRVRSNVGGFQFTETGTYATQCEPTDLTVGDFDGAGGVDLATADRRSGDVSVFWSDGMGGFPISATVPMTPNSAVFYIHAADFDGDGLDDIAAVEDNALAQTPLEILWSHDTWFTLQKYAGVNEVGPLQSGDLDGDGDLDLVAVVNQWGVSWFTTLLNEGGRTFSAGTSHLCGGSAQGVVVADLDPSNPLPDVAVCNSADKSISVFLQTRKSWPVLDLSVSMPCVYVQEQVTLTASNGAPSGILLAAVVTMNGSPSFVPVTLAAFDWAGRWKLDATIGPGYAGTDLELAVFGFDRNGGLSASNWIEVLFQ